MYSEARGILHYTKASHEVLFVIPTSISSFLLCGATLDLKNVKGVLAILFFWVVIHVVHSALAEGLLGFLRVVLVC